MNSVNQNEFTKEKYIIYIYNIRISYPNLRSIDSISKSHKKKKPVTGFKKFANVQSISNCLREI